MLFMPKSIMKRVSKGEVGRIASPFRTFTSRSLKSRHPIWRDMSIYEIYRWIASTWINQMNQSQYTRHLPEQDQLLCHTISPFTACCPENSVNAVLLKLQLYSRPTHKCSCRGTTSSSVIINSDTEIPKPIIVRTNNCRENIKLIRNPNTRTRCRFLIGAVLEWTLIFSSILDCRNEGLLSAILKP